MQSASTSLPSASVSAIQTVNPFLLWMISAGLQLRPLMKFYTIPTVTVTFKDNLSLTTCSKAARQLQAPLLSKNIGFRYSALLISKPPESKQTPLPIKATHLGLLGSPRQAILMRAGSKLLPRPTAWNKFSPCYFSSFPRSTWISRLYLLANSVYCSTKY